MRSSRSLRPLLRPAFVTKPLLRPAFVAKPLLRPAFVAAAGQAECGGSEAGGGHPQRAEYPAGGLLGCGWKYVLSGVAPCSEVGVLARCRTCCRWAVRLWVEVRSLGVAPCSEVGVLARCRTSCSWDVGGRRLECAGHCHCVRYGVCCLAGGAAGATAGFPCRPHSAACCLFWGLTALPCCQSTPHLHTPQLPTLLQTNVSVCSSLGHPFVSQFNLIFLDMLAVYK